MSKDDILEAISSMTVLELSELVEAFKTKFNVTISAAPVGAAPAGGGAGAGAAAVAEEQTEFAVTLKEAGAKKIQVIKVVRELTGSDESQARGAGSSRRSEVTPLGQRKRHSPSPQTRAVTLTATKMNPRPTARTTIEVLKSLRSGSAKISRLTGAGLFAPVGDSCLN
jgi:large subunit ribosomal protein L7/L12